MPYTDFEIQRIHRVGTAVPEQKYVQTNGNVYIGTGGKRLRLLDKADQVIFTPSESVPAVNVQSAVDGIPQNNLIAGEIKILTGIKNSSNLIFTCQYIPLYVIWNGQYLSDGAGYSLSDKTITMDKAPDSGDGLRPFGNIPK